ncbi:hypothetical protein TI39_contig4380g00001 [Zymoseptoria brevis]|uniref:Uncharacterized protein n=1 Tax=Zymoseptoria brevis TaxID=1047168 RepID=A0A0F4G714_9PEZI|nr:hypothetical protein TI39_contig4380g00001 [Zymoseptoria brevis]
MPATSDATDDTLSLSEDISSPAEEEAQILYPNPSSQTPHLPAHGLPTPQSMEEEEEEEGDQEEEEEEEEGDGDRDSESESEIEVDVDCVVEGESEGNCESDINLGGDMDKSTSISLIPPPSPAFWTPLLVSILVITGCIALLLGSISIQRQRFEASQPPQPPHPTIPAVPDFPTVDLARITRQLPTSGLQRSGIYAPVSRVLERVARQVEEVVGGVNRATRSTVGMWNRGVEEAVEGEVRAREQDGPVGRMMRDVEWWIGGSVVLRRWWAGGRAMAEVEIAVKESEDLRRGVPLPRFLSENSSPEIPLRKPSDEHIPSQAHTPS